MPDANDAFSTLDDFLLGLADGITRAQEELSRAGALGPAGRQFVYQLPRVDFELKMNMRVVEDETLTGRYRQLRPLRAGDKHLVFRPVTTEEVSSTLEIAAVVRGAFVAVPANNGLPTPLFVTTVDASDPRAPVVRVAVRNAAGEPIAGTEVQFNLDREESTALTATTGRTLVLDPGTRFERGVVTTDEAGVAESVLHVAPTQQPALLLLVFDAVERTDTLVYEVRP